MCVDNSYCELLQFHYMYSMECVHVFLNEQALFKYVYLWFKYSVVFVGQNSLLPTSDTRFGYMVSCKQVGVPDILQCLKGIVLFFFKNNTTYILKVVIPSMNRENSELYTQGLRFLRFWAVAYYILSLLI